MLASYADKVYYDRTTIGRRFYHVLMNQLKQGDELWIDGLGTVTNSHEALIKFVTSLRDKGVTLRATMNLCNKKDYDWLISAIKICMNNELPYKETIKRICRQQRTGQYGEFKITMDESVCYLESW